MNRLLKWAAVPAMLAMSQWANADIIDIVSLPGGPNNGTCTMLAGSGIEGASCSLVDITRHPAWATEPAAPYGGTWVSYARTGYGDPVLAPLGGTSAIFEVTESVTAAGGGTLDFWVWADDTADLYLNGDLVKAANFTQSTCANGNIGCEQAEYFHLQAALLDGVNTISMVFYQVGTGTNTVDNPFGILYSGRATTNTTVPEPGTLALLGLGLAGLGFARRRKVA